LAIKLDTIKY